MRREPLSASETHLSIVADGIVFLAPASAACIAVSSRRGLALWRTRSWTYEVRRSDGTLVATFIESPDPMTFPSPDLLSFGAAVAVGGQRELESAAPGQVAA